MKKIELNPFSLYSRRCDENCAYWRPDKKDSNGRTYCSWYGSYYYPSERQGCLSYK